jgi:predicted phosphodiesterase
VAETWLVLNDIQFPFHDEKVLALVEEFARDLKPHGIVLNGDIVDCYDISDFDKNPLTQATLDMEAELAIGLMGRLAKVAKERWWIGGNHEDRLRRFLWKQGDAFKVLGKRATKAAMEALGFPALFQLKDNGFKWKPYGGSIELGKLMVTHGMMVRSQSAASGRAHYERFGSSIMIGHTHRLGIYYRTNVRGVHAAYENGCLCKLTPEYAQHPDWQQGLSVVHVDKGGFYNVQQIPVLGRSRFYYGGVAYAA